LLIRKKGRKNLDGPMQNQFGGALLMGLDSRIREETGYRSRLPMSPSACVVLGTGKILDDFKLLRRLSIESMAS
jgi:actin-like ATPase involved in cell morphogenesis